MKEGFRQAMAWLHTWVGLVFGWLLFAIFLTGSLTYFKEELSRWAQPEVPAQALEMHQRLAGAERYLQAHAGGAASWYIDPGDERDPKTLVLYQQPGKQGRGSYVRKAIDPVTGQALDARGTLGGEFFYRFHFELELPYPWGRLIAGLAAFVMFVALITGIITHKKIFKEFFTFRPGKGQRSWLDGHNAAGVLALPFHLMITYSSLVILMYLLMPATLMANYQGGDREYFRELYPEVESTAPSSSAAPLSLAQLLDRYQQQVPGGQVGSVRVDKPGTAQATVTFQPPTSSRVAYVPGAGTVFSVAGGTLLHADEGARPLPQMIAGSFYGLHMGRFAHPLLRWLYFVCGLASTAMIGTGLVMWLSKRQQKHAKAAIRPFELRLVGMLNLAGMAGLVCAVAAFLCANRLLPIELPGRGGWEVRCFFLVWLGCLLHAAWRPDARGWVQQLTAAAVMLVSLPLLSQFTTGAGLSVSLPAGDWALAGIDLTAAAFGVLLAWVARRVRRKALGPALPRERARPLRAEQEAH